MKSDSNPAEGLTQRHRKVSVEQRTFFKKLRSKPPKDLDQTVHALHEEAFAKIDCLACANCCKTTGPLFTQRDIERIAKKIKLRPGEFIQKYLRTDEDGDLVLQSVPCPFLASDNYCGIYEVRPEACADYPHTLRRKMHLYLGIMEKNAAVCPAVFGIVEGIRRKE